MRPSDVLEELTGEHYNPWHRYLIDSNAASLVLQQFETSTGTGSSGPSSMADEVRAKFRAQDEAANRKKALLIKRGYDIQIED